MRMDEPSGLILDSKGIGTNATVVASAGVVLVAVAALTLGLVTDRATVTSAADMGHLEFGKPLAWFV